MDFEVLNLCVLSVYSQNTGCIGAHYDVGYFQHISSVVLETNIVPDSAGLPYSLLHPLREVGKNKISGCPICFALGGETEVGDLLIDLDQHLQHLGPEGLGGDHQADAEPTAEQLAEMEAADAAAATEAPEADPEEKE